MAVTASAVPRTPKPHLAILWGGLLCGVLDITAAFITFGLRGTSPIRLLQGIAYGLLGPETYNGGTATAALGLLCHFVVAFGAATVYYLASRKLRFMVEKPLVVGPLYGIAVWLFMSFVVMPLSAIGMPKVTIGSMALGWFVHMLCVGLPIALAVRAYSK
jgi:hypothetical protein